MVSQEQLADLQGLVAAWVQENCSSSSVDEAEATAEQVARAAGAAVADVLITNLGREKTYEGSRLPCECGERAVFVGYRSRRIATLWGEARVERAYYRCPACRRSQIPWDASQGLDARLWSARTKALVAEVGAQLPYQGTADLLERILGFRIEDSSAEEVMIDVGGRLRARQDALVAGYADGQIVPLWVTRLRRLYVTMDGAIAHIGGSWHEVKTGVVYQGVPGKDGIDTTYRSRYVAAQEQAERFGSRLYMLAAMSGVQAAEEVVVIGDGADWIWNIADHHYAGATQILDFFHATEHIRQLARDYYGEGSKQGKRWADEHCHALKHHGPKKLLTALKRMKPKTPEQAEALRLQLGYFTRNEHRMNYPQFRERGMMIGSGPAEAGCKVVVGQRLKGAGMRWSEKGADAALAVRAALLSGDTAQIADAARAA